MKFGFVTCVQLGLACMEEIYRVGGKLELAITLKDELAKSKSGRVYSDDFCAEHSIPVVKIGNVNDESVVSAVRERKIDWLFIVGWSQIARAAILQAPRRGVLGMHPTLLPTGRGRAAIPWAILKKLPETGVTLFQLDEGVDTGAVVAQERLPLAPDETATHLYSRVVEAHQKLIRRVWWELAEDRLTPQTQDESKATVWSGRKPEDGEIKSSMTVEEADCLVRATTHPYPGAFWQGAGTKVIVWEGRKATQSYQPPPGAKSLQLADGIFYALNYELEASATT